MAKVITTELQHSGASAANITLDSSKNVTCENNLQVDGNVTVTGTLPADKLTGNLPAISGASLTGIATNPKENLVINGDFQVWQRRDDDTSDPVSGYCGPDRWQKVWYGGTVTGKKVAITSGTPFDEGFRSSFQMKCTSTTSGNDHYSLFQYKFESQDLATSGWKYKDSSSKIRVQFWAKSSLAGKYWVEFQSQDGTKRAYPYSFNLSADTWTKISFAIPGDSNLTIDNDVGAGAKLTIYTHLGTDYTNDSGTATATWKNQDGAASTEDYDQNWLNTANATWDITGVQVTVGETAGDFQHRSFGDELLKCQRYFQVYHDKVGVILRVHSSTQALGHIPLHNRMRDVPTYAIASSNANFDVLDNGSVLANQGHAWWTWSAGGARQGGFELMGTRGAGTWGTLNTVIHANFQYEYGPSDGHYFASASSEL